MADSTTTISVKNATDIGSALADVVIGSFELIGYSIIFALAMAVHAIILYIIGWVLLHDTDKKRTRLPKVSEVWGGLLAMPLGCVGIPQFLTPVIFEGFPYGLATVCSILAIWIIILCVATLVYVSYFTFTVFRSMNLSEKIASWKHKPVETEETLELNGGEISSSQGMLHKGADDDV